MGAKTEYNYDDHHVVLGSIELSNNAEIIFYVANYKGYPFAHVRKFIRSDKYAGPTKHGIALRGNILDQLIELLNQFQTKLNVVSPKEIGRVPKNNRIDVVVSLVRSPNGAIMLDIREYVRGDQYEGPTRKGIRLDYEFFQKVLQLLEKMKPYLDYQQIGQETLFNYNKKTTDKTANSQKEVTLPDKNEELPGVPSEYKDLF